MYYVDIGQIPDTLQKSFVVMEDKDFYKHKGIDFKAIIRAVIANTENDEIVQGASTITQQLAKNIFLSQEVTWQRKVKEIFVAWDPVSYTHLFILVMAVIARIKINKVDASDTPGMFQNAIEIIVEMLGTMVDGIMGKNANKFVNYISTLFLFIIISNISGLFGLRPPTADYGVTLCLGLITFILVQFNGIKKNRIKDVYKRQL